MKKQRFAITGGIGSGKSTVLRAINDFGYPTFSCDSIYRELLTEKGYLEKLSLLFPAVFENGSLSKEKLSKLVFSSKENLNKLNALAHPLIMERLYAEMEKHKISFAEVPLLFEGGYEKDFDKIIVVVRPKNERIEAVVERDKKSKETVLETLKSQFNYETDLSSKISENVFVLKNENSKEELVKSLKNLLNEYIL
ncbi:MAG: dephospho-CoA kinase [Clostridia bacterium]|nr:dephospho-CoA kinase [Clostridia bacterium]